MLILSRFHGPTNNRHPHTTCFLTVLFYVCYSCEPAGGNCCCPSGSMAHVQDSSLIGFTGSNACQLTLHLLHAKAPRSASCCIVVYEENAFWAIWVFWPQHQVATEEGLLHRHVASLVSSSYAPHTHTQTELTQHALHTNFTDNHTSCLVLHFSCFSQFVVKKNKRIM